MDMKSKSFAFPFLVMTALSLCCKTNETGPQEETYIPLITNSWTDTSRPTHQFNFVQQQTNVPTGTFNGEEIESFITVSDTLFGVFSNRNISFTVRKGTRDTTYVGRFIADTLIDLGRLKLFRQN
jgi:hypothetical protein